VGAGGGSRYLKKNKARESKTLVPAAADESTLQGQPKSEPRGTLGGGHRADDL